MLQVACPQGAEKVLLKALALQEARTPRGQILVQLSERLENERRQEYLQRWKSDPVSPRNSNSVERLLLIQQDRSFVSPTYSVSSFGSAGSTTEIRGQDDRLLVGSWLSRRFDPTQAVYSERANEERSDEIGVLPHSNDPTLTVIARRPLADQFESVVIVFDKLGQKIEDSVSRKVVREQLKVEANLDVLALPAMPAIPGSGLKYFERAPQELKALGLLCAHLSGSLVRKVCLALPEGWASVIHAGTNLKTYGQLLRAIDSRVPLRIESSDPLVISPALPSFLAESMIDPKVPREILEQILSSGAETIRDRHTVSLLGKKALDGLNGSAYRHSLPEYVGGLPEYLDSSVFNNGQLTKNASGETYIRPLSATEVRHLFFYLGQYVSGFRRAFVTIENLQNLLNQSQGHIIIKLSPAKVAGVVLDETNDRLTRWMDPSEVDDWIAKVPARKGLPRMTGDGRRLQIEMWSGDNLLLRSTNWLPPPLKDARGATLRMLDQQ